MIVSVDDFSKYSNVFSDNSELQESYIISSQNIVSDYLGYNPEFQLLNFTAGELENINISEVPEIIKMTVLRIAALLQSEGNSNIGVTSK